MKPTDPGAVYPHAEVDLAASLGVAQDLLKRIRKEDLKRGADWDVVRSKVSFSDSGRKKIRDALGIGEESAVASEPVVAPDLAPNTSTAEDMAIVDEAIATLSPAVIDPPPADPAIVDLVCHKLPKNRRIILARLGAGKEVAIVRVRVKDSAKFVAGMELKARHLAEDLYELEGKAPRWVGKF